MDKYYDAYFRQYSEMYLSGTDLDWLWVKCQAVAESGLNPDAKSPAGAQGVMQLMPSTAREMAGKLKIECLPWVPHINIQMGVACDRRCWEVWRKEVGIERIRFTLASYNAGIGNIVKAQNLAGQWGLPTDRWDSIARALPQITGEKALETIAYITRIERPYRSLTEGEA